jgi:hypothetical protein
MVKARKTLVQMQSEHGVTDPSQHAKRQVAELDKTAARSLAKRKFITEQLASDAKELAHLDHELAELHKSYDPLCRELADREEKKISLLKSLEACMQQQQAIMGNVKDTVLRRKQEDMKLNSRLARAKMESERGYTLGPSSTFKQSGNMSLTSSKTMGKAGKRGMAASTGKLPPIGSSGDGMKRNESAML